MSSDSPGGTAAEFDHLVHFVPDPETARMAFETLGIHTVAGGRHVEWGTYNTLAYFDLAYIEWLGVEDAVKAREFALGQQAMALLPRGGGAARFAVRVRDIEARAARWQAAGLSFVGPMPGRRMRPDGSVIEWSLLFPLHEDWMRLPVPFAIQWQQDDETRRKDLLDRGALSAAPEGQWALRRLIGMVRQPSETVARWLAYYPEWRVDSDGQDTVVHAGQIDVVLRPLLQSEEPERFTQVILRPLLQGAAETAVKEVRHQHLSLTVDGAM
ncbi:MAG: VOC family protein [Thermoflavifilum sp.]|nr:VOC family protein [Thermoflavifilum sp.]MCL6513001.1 VOC family protein [Alicyclobacillus sp.]